MSAQFAKKPADWPASRRALRWPDRPFIGRAQIKRDTIDPTDGGPTYATTPDATPWSPAAPPRPSLGDCYLLSVQVTRVLFRAGK